MTGTLSRIDSDDLSLRRVQNVVSNKTATLQGPPLKVVQKGYSTVSTISAAPPIEEPVYQPLRPELTPSTVDLEDGEQLAIEQFLTHATAIGGSDVQPEIKKAYLKLVLEIHALAEDVAARHVQHISTQIRSESAELEQLNLKQTEAIRKHVLEASKESTWSFLGKIMQYFLSAATIVLGSVLIATGVAATAGAFLLAAGGLGLLNSIAQDTGAYQAIAGYFTKSRELQDTIASWIATTILFATIGLGVAGGVMTYFSPGIEAARASMTAVDAAKKIEIAIGLASAGVAVGKANSDNDTAQIQKPFQILAGRIFLLKQELQKTTAEAKSTIQMMQSISNQTRQAVAAFNQ